MEGFFVNTLVLDDEVLDPFVNTLVLGDGVDVVGVGFILVGVGVVFVVVGGFVLVGVGGFVLVGVDPLEPLILTYPLADKPDFPFCATVDALFPVPIFLIALLTPDDMEDDVAVEGVEPNLA